MNSPMRFNDSFVANSKRFSRVAGVFAMLVGALVLAGWAFDIHALKSVYANITMKANAALSLLLAGASLLALNLAGEKPLSRRAGQACAAVIALVGALTLSEHLVGWNLGIDQLLFTEPAGEAATTSPGRMGPPASSCFTLLGAALLLLHARRAVSLAQGLSIAAGLWSLFAIIGYAYQAEELYDIARYTGIALHTAVSLFALSLGLLAARVDCGMTAVISGKGAGGLMARRLLIPAISMPFLLGWLRLMAQRAGYFDLGFGTALLVLAIIIIFTIAILENAARLNHTEQRRLAAEATARESEERLRVAIKHAPLTVFNQDRELRYIWVHNPAPGFRAEEMLGKRDGDLIGTEDAEALARIKRRVLESGLGAHEEVKIDAGGNRHFYDLTVEPLRDATGQIAGVTCAAIDITGIKQVEAELRRANEIKDEFLATVSHELRTPLNGILGWITMLRRGKLDEATAALALETIERNARAQAQLVEDLLDVSRIISGKLRLTVEPTELISVLTAAIDSVRPAAAAKGIHLQAALDQSANVIQGDADRLQQVVWNLLANAVKFTAKGGQVRVALGRADSKARITVSDTGEGISPDFLPYIFDRFQQADGTTTRRHGGLGLGLAITRHLVEMHGGTIEAYSAGVGRGAAFTIRLPLAAVRHTETPASERAPLSEKIPAGVDSSRLAGLRILAVDDEPDALEMLKVILEQYGAEMMTAASARDALDALLEWRPDVLVCDIGMPEEDGYSLIRKVRTLNAEQGGNTPAVAVTGYVRIEERVQALQAGYQMFVPKPLEADELTLTIENLVGREERIRNKRK